MFASRIIAFAGRMLIVLGVVVLGFGTPAMASGSPTDCMSMMQDGGQMSKTMPDMGKQCPYAAVCAVAGLYVAPTPPTDFVTAAMSDVDFLSFDENNGAGFLSSPPSRPPRS